MFLRGVIFLLVLGVLALCIFVLPAGIISDTAGYYRPILIGLYVPASPFFVALYQALKLLGYIDKNAAFSPLSVKALKNIKYCAIATQIVGISFTAVSMPVLFLVFFLLN